MEGKKETKAGEKVVVRMEWRTVRDIGRRGSYRRKGKRCKKVGGQWVGKREKGRRRKGRGRGETEVRRSIIE